MVFQQFQELMLFSHCVATDLTDPSPLHFAKTRREGGGGRGGGRLWRFDPAPTPVGGEGAGMGLCVLCIKTLETYFFST